MHDARSAYLETQVLTAAPQKLRLMLIEGCMRLVEQARAAHASGNRDLCSSSLTRARDIVTELIAGIRPDSESINVSARAVYGFIYKSLAEAQLLKEPEKLAEALRVLEEERQTWLAVCELNLPPQQEAESFRQQEVLARDFKASPVAVTGRLSLDA